MRAHPIIWRYEYDWHRYYDPSIGRYVSADPIGQAGGINLYAYAYNSPTNVVDPTGEYGLPGAVGGALFNAGLQIAAGLYASDGDWEKALKCVNLTDIAVSAAIGAVAPTALGNVALGKAGPYGHSRAQDAALWAGGALPGGYLAKKLVPDYRIGDECECQGLDASSAIGEFAHGF